MPVMPPLEVVGKGTSTLPIQIGSTCVNSGIVCVKTVMVILASEKQTPETGLGVKVYSVVKVLFIAGDQVPLKPSFETVGKSNKTSPKQMVSTSIKLGVKMEFTPIVIVAVLAQGFASGVKV